MKQILVVEDDPAIARLEKDYLELAGFGVALVGDGPSGLEQGLTGRFDLVVLDLMIPGLGGLDVCQKLRESLDIPILVVSSKTDDIDKIRALGLGADDFMTKPFSPGELTARVKAHISRYERLRRSLPEDASVVEYRDLKLNRSSRQLWLRDREVIFTSKEFDILELFLLHRGVVLSRDEVYSRVWGEQFGDTSTVTVHIRRIREKLGEDPSQPRFIKTIWGSGYRLDH